jgi:hypothetical protein
MRDKILNWIKQNKLRKKEYLFLLKSYINFRSNNMLSINKVILTYSSNVRPLKERGLMKINELERNKKENWYDFTDEGYELVKQLDIVPIEDVKTFINDK